MRDAAEQLTMNAFRVTDALKVYMQMTFLLALLMISPLILYQLWSFISPGLLEKERKVTLGYIPVSVILFLTEWLFIFYSFSVCDSIYAWLSGNMDIQTTIGINEYFQFLFQITFRLDCCFNCQ